MALATTTLSAAVAIIDNSIVVASATSFAAGRLVVIDGEEMQVAQNYTTGTTIPVLRGRSGTQTLAHKSSANVNHGLASDFASPPAGLDNSNTYGVVRATLTTSISATSSLPLPTAGTDLRVILNGTSVITLTVPVPTKDMDGVKLTILSNGAAAHVVTFTSTLNNAGSGYTSFTNNASGTMGIEAYACNGFWTVCCAPAWTGTVTKVTGGIA